MNYFAIFKISLLCFYALSINTLADTFVSEDVITNPTPDNFSICHDHTCTKVSKVRLSAENWQHIRRFFHPPAVSAKQERVQLKLAIAKLEYYVGALTGTSGDKGKNLDGVGEEGQLDCIDESTNTSIYLMMLQKDGLMTKHIVMDRETRGFLPFSWPHTTAVIREKNQQTLFAVDSWFRDNGYPPYIIPFQEWEDGWRPN